MTDADGWEARMAARAAQRARDAPRPVDPHWWNQGPPIGSTVPTMTLGEAVDLLSIEPFACACSGGPWCCAYAYPQAERLKWAAHVVVRLLVDTFTPTAITTTKDGS